jgi:hypothetical protein
MKGFFRCTLCDNDPDGVCKECSRVLCKTCLNQSCAMCIHIEGCRACYKVCTSCKNRCCKHCLTGDVDRICIACDAWTCECCGTEEHAHAVCSVKCDVCNCIVCVDCIETGCCDCNWVPTGGCVGPCCDVQTCRLFRQQCCHRCLTDDEFRTHYIPPPIQYTRWSCKRAQKRVRALFDKPEQLL